MKKNPNHHCLSTLEFAVRSMKVEPIPLEIPMMTAGIAKVLQRDSLVSMLKNSPNHRCLVFPVHSMKVQPTL